MKIEILTIFPDLFSGFLESSLIGKARAKGAISITTTDIRRYAEPPHHQVDDTPYGGGAGMLMKPEPLCRAIEDARTRLPAAKVVLLSASGPLFRQATARRLSALPELILVCGRYEGVDQRVIDLVVDEQLSIGEYVLMGGEVPAMVVIEACTRLIPGIVGNEASIEHESFDAKHPDALLEAPQYTRPPEFRGLHVPEVLLSGNHKKIEEWRFEQSRALTRKRRQESGEQ